MLIRKTFFSKSLRIPLIITIIALISLQAVISPAEAIIASRPTEDIWALLAKNAKLKVDLANPRIKEQIEFYTKRPQTLHKITDQAEPYLQFILTEIEKRNLPHELLLLPIMESAYDPKISSHAGATGLWQFMPRTADHFGIHRDWWYDGRIDIDDSTNKALDYMMYLVKFFDGDWQLAAAAYDAGEGTVQRAIKKNKEAGKPTDFWSLDLPSETKKYVPRLLALAEIFSHPKKYGLELNPVENRPYLKKVDLGRQMSLVKVAELANIDLESLVDVNPGNKVLVTSPQGPHTILVPVTNANTLEKNLAKLGKNDTRSWFKYSVNHGDSLQDLAQRHNTSETMIKKINRLTNNITLTPGLQLALPLPITQKVEPTKPFGKQKMIYAISKNDSLWTISKKFQVKLSELKQWNPELNPDKLLAGELLTLWISPKMTEATTPSPSIAAQTHTVVRGDSLFEIAKRYGTNVDAIKALNDLKTNTLQIGQTLSVPAITS